MATHESVVRITATHPEPFGLFALAWSARCLFILLACMASGCDAHALARQMVIAPNRRLGAPPPVDVGTTQAGSDRLMIPVGPPEASLAAWVVEPKTGPARGTIIVLHGFLANHSFVRYAADAFSQAGYRAVLVDLRGHGDSTGRHITFGVDESRDLVQLTDYLIVHHLAGPRIGVYGVSLGAAIAIQFAALDPRVTTVVAVAPFATLRDETPHFARTMLPLPGLFISESDYTQVLKDAGEIAHFDPDQASPLSAIAHTKAKILLIHGEMDAVIPADDSRTLHAAAPDHSELVILPAAGHLAACFDLGGDVPSRACAFFDAHLAAAKP